MYTVKALRSVHYVIESAAHNDTPYNVLASISHLLIVVGIGYSDNSVGSPSAHCSLHETFTYMTW